METGAWLPSASPTSPGVWLNAPRRPTSRFFPLVGNFVAKLWPAFDPFDLDDFCYLTAASMQCAAPSLPGLTSMLRVILHLRGSFPAWSRPKPRHFRGPHPSPASSPPPRGLPGPLGWGLAHGHNVMRQSSRSLPSLPGGSAAQAPFAVMGTRLRLWHVWRGVGSR